jgi:hypothetical protein
MLTRQGTVSNNITNELRVTNHPFFISNAINGTPMKYSTETKYQILEEDANLLHKEILNLYKTIGYDKEYKIKLYSFMSLNEIIERKSNFEYFYDIALKYLGMGHIVLISYHQKSNRFFFRRDGGSNGWDREANYNKYKNYEPDINNIEKEENPIDYSLDILYTFEQMMNIINNSSEEYD